MAFRVVMWQRGDVGDVATRWACLLACQSFFDASGVVGSGEGWWKVDGGGWRQWMRVVMWLMAVVDGHQKWHGQVGPVRRGRTNSVESM